MGTVVGHPASPENVTAQCQHCATGLLDHFSKTKHDSGIVLFNHIIVFVDCFSNIEN